MDTRRWIEAKRASLLDEDHLRDRLRSVTRLRERWRADNAELEIVCRRSCYQREDMASIKRRETFIDFLKNDEIIATAEFMEWDKVDRHFAYEIDLIDECDAVSSGALEMAVFVTSNWDEFEHPLDYGTIVVFNRLVITRETDAVWHAISDAIDIEFGKASIMVLKPFPLEWEGDLTEENEERFIHRQAAMMRCYRRRLGVETIDGDPGEWMWKPIRGPEPVPGMSAEWHERDRGLRLMFP